jgi:membrane protein implicated in regulation of membrane protease activity
MTTELARRRHCSAGTALVALVTVLIVMALSADASAQCAMCQTLLGSPEGQRMIAAIRSGILLLLVAPFVIFATVATLAIRLQRRRRALEGAAHE